MTTLLDLPSGRKLEYILSGPPKSRQIVLLSNALLAPLQTWDPFVSTLHAHQFRTLQYNQTGHGQSTPPTNPDTDTTFFTLATDVRCLLEHLEIRTLYAWIGTSMGGATGVVFAATNPGVVGKLVVVSARTMSPGNANAPDTFEPRVQIVKREESSSKGRGDESRSPSRNSSPALPALSSPALGAVHTGGGGGNTPRLSALSSPPLRPSASTPPSAPIKASSPSPALSPISSPSLQPQSNSHSTAINILTTQSLRTWFTPSFLSSPSNQPELTRLRHIMHTTTPAGFIACCRALQSSSFDLRPFTRRLCYSVREGVLLVAGERDQGIVQSMSEMRADVGRAWAAAGRGVEGDIKMQVLEGAGHFCVIDGREAFEGVVMGFLEEGR